MTDEPKPQHADEGPKPPGGAEQQASNVLTLRPRSKPSPPAAADDDHWPPGAA